ncbi:MAG: type II toxin-antitoxin system PemK/MazF family toxin [Candidatus Woesearchaeota archaeon]
MNRGEVWFVELPSTQTHEQAGKRPAIVLTEPIANIITVIPTTSNVQALRFPYTSEIKPSKEHGLNELSIALVFHIRAIDRKRLLNKIGEISKAEQNAINLMLKTFLHLQT